MAFSIPPPTPPGFTIPQCGECGIPLRNPTKLILCPLCHKPLCERCNRSGLCPGHYASLTPEDRMKIDVIAQKIKSSQKLVILLNILPMAIFLPLFFIILSGAFDGMLSGFPFFFLIFCCPGFGVSNTVKRKITLLMQERDLILEPYKDVDISNIPYTVPPPQSLPSNPISSSTTATPPLSSDRPLFVEELTANGKFCQNCRNTNPFSARFCLKCGKKL